jgi:hypothetical protein
VPNGNNNQTSRKQIQASYTDVRYWKELIEFIEKITSPNEPFCLTAIYQRNIMQDELDAMYLQVYTPGQMINDPLYGQISFNGFLSNAFKLKLGHNVKLFLVDIKEVTRKNIADHVMGPPKVISTSLSNERYAHCKLVYLDF